MRRLGSILLLAAGLSVLASGIASAAGWFQIRPAEVPYRNVGIEVFNEQFNLDIDSPVASDQLMVEFTTHVPDGWFAQFCQVSTGICYFGSHAITLPVSGDDRIQVDFFMNQGLEEIGWVDLRIYRVSDPGTFQEITYAIGHGVVMPTSRFSFTSNNVFGVGNPNETIELRGLLKSFDNFNDQLIVTVSSSLPAGWMAQFCQTSTGICYFGNATITFPAMTIDTLRVDFFCFNPDPGIGNFRLRVQSAANPAMWTALPFRARTGNIPADADDRDAMTPFAASVAPNPVRQKAEIRLGLVQPTGVQLRIHDIAGRMVLDRDLPSLGAGLHRIAWDATDAQGRPLPSGTYFYTVTGAGRQADGKFVIQR
jgi:hypothetical protein